MRAFSLNQHRRYLDDEAGLNRLVSEQIAESRFIDFKLAYARRDPAYSDAVRADCGSLATAGEGYLVVGIDDSRDGRDVARSVVGIETTEALALKKSIEDLVAERISPPLVLQSARLVPLRNGNQVLVVHVKGRADYPVTIELTEGKGRTASYLRRGPSNKPLSAENAEIARQRADLRRSLKVGLATVLLSGITAALLPLVAQPDLPPPTGPIATSASGTQLAYPPEILSLPPALRPPRELGAALGEGLTLLQAKKLDAAESAISRAEAQQGTWYGALLLGRIDMERGEHARAVSLLQLAEARYFDLLTATSAETESKTREALLAEMQRDTQAHADVQLWISDPQLSLIYGNLTAALTNAGRPREAEAVGRLALSIAPRDSLAMSNLGAALRAQGKMEEAKTVFSRVLELEPNDPTTRVNLGEVLRAAGDRSSARIQFELAVAADPQFGPAWAGIGELAMEANDDATAVDAFTRVRKLSPLDASARNNLCLVLGRQGRWQDAITACEEATRLAPSDPVFWVNLGFTLFDSRALDSHNLDRSCDAMARAVALAPTTAEGHLGQANCLAARGQQVESRREYSEFLRLAEKSGCCQSARDFVRKKLAAE